jgi:molybdopterin-guanine dinucleotide biosynthesis protein A
MTPLHGIVLAGGLSTRMQADKAVVAIARRPQLARAFELLAPRVARAWVSVRADQAREPLRAGYPQVVDGKLGRGPIAGIIAAQALHSNAAWLVLACDLPLLDGETLDQLISGRDPSRIATAFRSADSGLPEPLCAIYEPASREAVLAHVAGGHDCPRKFLLAHEVALLDPLRPHALANANTPQDLDAAIEVLASGGAR